jgi:hypothetical protein
VPGSRDFIPFVIVDAGFPEGSLVAPDAGVIGTIRKDLELNHIVIQSRRIPNPNYNGRSMLTVRHDEVDHAPFGKSIHLFRLLKRKATPKGRLCSIYIPTQEILAPPL